ncbi:quinone-dependent dihydroorotate dehydrogenase [Natrarchaeobius chitinivorans]|uniref:Dihydroorotate dehydrogenase (quinone) n=1 Tax=Natrarchaeobius chitinivorans TaxID=1679083 RepID=A0A3N6M548_NATCH|nr:quinone-dependent dihydroorotate dehydrogenase [Natrarchaeobius chitinivorans]RQG97167.1 quinone-dependent dihydroorotate dehydrogenase [Natrarchaeobius chitinivorans]
MTLYSRVRPLAFKLPPERAHTLGKQALRGVQATYPTRALVSYAYQYDHPALEVDLFGTTFPNPVGVAAGFDKNAEVTHALEALGFGFVEIGTVTPYSQTGNDRPRLFRLREDRAMVNRMGFNGHGMDRVKSRLERDGVPGFPLGVNVGKMNTSTEGEAIEDYRRVFDRLSPFADYVVVNVSCPNTPEKFDESSPDHLRAIFETLEEENDTGRPILVKIGPDSPEESILDLVDIVTEFDVDGIVATNTTTERDGLESPNREEWGGLSGEPLADRSTALVRTLAEYTDGELPIVGVGGVDSAERAYEKIRAGASLVQLYTGFVYEGPSTAKQINRGLVDLLERDGFSSVEDAVGADLE